jgi:hypothetical protein
MSSALSGMPSPSLSRLGVGMETARCTRSDLPRSAIEKAKVAWAGFRNVQRFVPIQTEGL